MSLVSVCVQHLSPLVVPPLLRIDSDGVHDGRNSYSVVSEKAKMVASVQETGYSSGKTTEILFSQVLSCNAHRQQKQKIVSVLNERFGCVKNKKRKHASVTASVPRD